MSAPVCDQFVDIKRQQHLIRGHARGDGACYIRAGLKPINECWCYALGTPPMPCPPMVPEKPFEEPPKPFNLPWTTPVPWSPQRSGQ